MKTHDIKYDIPPGSPKRNCRGPDCGKEIYLIPSGKTDPQGRPKHMPVNPDGSPHWMSCVNADTFRRKR